MARDPETLAHIEWLGFVQPVGLVVSIPALLSAQAHINRNIAPDHQRFLDCLPRDKSDNPIPEIRDFAAFTQQVLGWRPADLEPVPDGDARFAALEVPLPEYHEALRPTHVVREPEPKDPNHPWMMLVQVVPTAVPLDEPPEQSDRRWHASPQARFERLLRETRVPIGLLTDATQIRLVYAPRGETSGFATFNVAEMTQVAGRPIFAALHLLFGEERLFSLGEKQRLPAILADSRKFQNVVSTQLADQVLSALFELLRGFQAADDTRKGELLRAVLADNPHEVYSGLLTVLMRLVFILYAEDRGLLSADPIYANYYSLTGLFDRLRADAGRYPDTMDQRFGAWAQLLTLFRLIYDGGRHGGFHLPARKGYLFDTDKYPFLEGRPWKTRRSPDESCDVPRVSDGVIFRVLHNLLILDGERLSYRTLDVEQIGSVYEAMMGFDLAIAKGRSIAIQPKKQYGAPTTVNLEELLAAKPAERGKRLKQQTDRDLAGKAADALRKAASVEDLMVALDKTVALAVTPNIVPAGAMVFQPSDERRRSGSHYTPRSLTEPIVRKALEPILKNFGDQPTPQQILDLKVCDPAMGSGAFLVEACRQLAEHLVKAWAVTGTTPTIPPDEDELLHARRLVAQRCLYGVDKNPMAVALAKLSLWLATLAKDHPFTFLDHALRCGDSLVGLSQKQIAAFDWGSHAPLPFLEARIRAKIFAARAKRDMIHTLGDDTPYGVRAELLREAEESQAEIRQVGDLAVATFFARDPAKARESLRKEVAESALNWLTHGTRTTQLDSLLAELRGGEHPIEPFHWEIEFPEVFGRVGNRELAVASREPESWNRELAVANRERKKPTSGGKAAQAADPHSQLPTPNSLSPSGFDCIVGNPPFAGKNTITAGNRGGFLDWLKATHEESHGNADLVAHFFRRAFDLLRAGGTFGLIATNTIAQGDTRSTGLRWICTHGGTIYHARRRYKWPGQAAVVVSVVHVAKGFLVPLVNLDGKAVDRITAYLFHAGGDEDPVRLLANAGKCFVGSYVLGMGFTFDDTDTSGVANPISLMNDLIAKDPRNAERIFPYLGGEEVNESPTHTYHRYVINFGEMSEADARKWPDLMKIVEEKVRPGRQTQGSIVNPARWWMFARPASDLAIAVQSLPRVLACCLHQQHWCLTFLQANAVFTHGIGVVAAANSTIICVMQSRIHEAWVRFFGSSLEDRLRYTPSDCFETFPFPKNFETDARLEAVGQEYYEFRAALMVNNNEGLTKTYNRFHDPDERSPEILKLRELHASMDRAVLDAYGPPFSDLVVPKCDFFLDYEEEEDEEAAPGKRHRKKPWRYRWPDEFRDKVLALLLEFNRQRAEEERLAGATSPGAKPKRATRSRTKTSDGPDLF